MVRLLVRSGMKSMFQGVHLYQRTQFWITPFWVSTRPAPKLRDNHLSQKIHFIPIAHGSSEYPSAAYLGFWFIMNQERTLHSETPLFFNQQEASQYSTNGRLTYLVLGMFIDHHDENPPSLFIREDLVRDFSIITPACVTSSLFVVCAAWAPSVEQHLCVISFRRSLARSQLQQHYTARHAHHQQYSHIADYFRTGLCSLRLECVCSDGRGLVMDERFLCNITVNCS